MAKLIPIYYYRSTTPVWRYFYTTDPDIKEGWTREGIAFYAFADATPLSGGSTPVQVYRYYAADKNPWRYLYSTKRLAHDQVPGWILDEGIGIGGDQPFYAIDTFASGEDVTPVFQFFAVDKNPWRYAYALDPAFFPPESGWARETDPTFLVGPGGAVFFVFNADVP